jgi:phosphate starvation-inducible PhoH-like protein
VEGVKFVAFAPKDIVRLPVVQRIIEAYQAGRSQNSVPQRPKSGEGEGKAPCPTRDV